MGFVEPISGLFTGDHGYCEIACLSKGGDSLEKPNPLPKLLRSVCTESLCRGAESRHRTQICAWAPNGILHCAKCHFGVHNALQTNTLAASAPVAGVGNRNPHAL